MKKIRIFAFPTHGTTERTSGVDFARIIQPMKHLGKHKDFEVHVFSPEEKTNWIDVAKEYDFIYFNYLNNAWGFAAMGAMARKHGVKLIMDVDDALWEILPDNPAHEVYKEGTEAIRNFTAICNEVDYITTTSMYLKHVICNNTHKHPTEVKVFPNYIDLDLYSHRSKFKDTNEIVLLHFGCFDDQTEILTNDGFKFFKDLNKNERVATINKQGYLEYKKPVKYMEYDFDGKLMCAEGHQVNYAVTPNHQLYTSKPNKEDFNITIACDTYKKNFRIKKNAYWMGKEKKMFKIGSKSIFMDDWLKFFGFWLAEGWTTKNKFKQKSGNITDCMQIGVVHKKSAKILDTLEKAMVYAGFNVKRDDRGQLRIYNKELWNYLRPLGGAGEKYIPEEIKKLSSRQLKILLDHYLIGDGSIEASGRIRATTVSKKLVDDLTEIALKIGWSANYYLKEQKDVVIEGRKIPVDRQLPCYTISFLRSEGKKNCLRPKVFPKHQFEKEYKGKVYDVEVPNHTLYVRRNGKCMWSGNSTTHFLDLEEEEFMKGIDKIMSEYPNVVFKTVGAMIPDYKKKWGMRYINDFGDPDIYKWIKGKYPLFMDEADIIVTPLKKGIYTKAKSSIKFLEASAARKAGIWQNIRQYEEVIDGNNGFLAESADDWYQSIKMLIDDKTLRRKMGERAFATVEKNWKIQDKVEDYAEWFKKILDSQ